MPPFDPSAPRGPLYRAYDSFIRSKVGRAIAINVATKLDPVLLKASHGRYSAGLMMPSVRLTTTGAKSGEPREAAVLYFTDGADVILIASNFGRERHPAWYHNLVAHPEALLERDGVSARYTATEVTDPAERERLYGLATKVYAGYADYKAMTDAIGRRIPIMRLMVA
ncbi:MAG: nitroreductase family deazaflavin-dependent oxidoreductase [Solirubrobacterales bacterium]|nr:nitroreductase family deazaflavin-dependent oxidoreductase [Solirubrobacterales bacterium]